MGRFFNNIQIKKGQVSWYVWKQFKSKHRFIEDFNRRWSEFGEGAKRTLINPDDYDL